MKLKIIKTDSDYQEALEHIESLMFAERGTEEAEELELLMHLVSEYEDEHFPIPLPDPIAAIRFRMDQQGLKQKDLVPYIGSKSKVSEVLNGIRPLTLSMIRKLHNGLGIPADVLLGDENRQLSPEPEELDVTAFPLSEMVKRRWFGNSIQKVQDLLDRREELLFPFLKPTKVCFSQVTCYQRRGLRKRDVNEYALWAWQARVWSLVKNQELGEYNPGSINSQFIKEIVRLSMLDDGPVIARDMLAKMGIGLVFEKNLPKTYLDGAAIRMKGESPFIALTLRYDRLDNFWFTLCHELAHVSLHLKKDGTQGFLDDLEETDNDIKETEADKIARNAIIKDSVWQAFLKDKKDLTPEDIFNLSGSQRIHPALIAGRYRKETSNYQNFTGMVGQGKVRRLFYTTPV